MRYDHDFRWTRTAPAGRGTFARDGKFEIVGMSPGNYRISVSQLSRFESLSGAADVQITNQDTNVEIVVKSVPSQR